ncbi:hypothetical protein PUN28_002956 [Cardiocondyla obscurior]|uniref:Secreted protein n=1 Tax=Cardiocondyla obscurior TaxID=286306 RepID=A0AAW2GX78_9HYME
MRFRTLKLFLGPSGVLSLLSLAVTTVTTAPKRNVLRDAPSGRPHRDTAAFAKRPLRVKEAAASDSTCPLLSQP